MKKKFRDLLHAYRVQAFKISHNNNDVEATTQEILSFTDEALSNAYRYHFPKDPPPDPRTIEIFNMIKNYTLEALLPPVVEKIMRRVTSLEKQHEELVALVDRILEALSDDEASGRQDVG